MLDKKLVDKALRKIVIALDYDLHKSLEQDDETGEDTYYEYVEIFINEYSEGVIDEARQWRDA